MSYLQTEQSFMTHSKQPEDASLPLGFFSELGSPAEVVQAYIDDIRTQYPDAERQREVIDDLPLAAQGTMTWLGRPPERRSPQ